VTNFFGSVMKTLHTDSAYTGFLSAHDDETPMSIRDNQHDQFMSNNEASARRSNREKVNISLRKFEMECRLFASINLSSLEV